MSDNVGAGALPSAGRRRRSEASKGDRRELALLESAERLLHHRALSELTVEAVAAGAGVSRSAFYFYFDGKAAIVDALIEQVSREMLEPFEQHVGTASLSEYIEIALSAAFAGWRRHRPVFQAAIETASQGPDNRDRWRENMQRFIEALAQVAAREQAAGRLPPDTDAHQWAGALVWMVERNCYLLFTREHSERDEHQLFATLDLMMRRGFGLPEPDSAGQRSSPTS